MKKTATKVCTILLLLIKTFDLVNAQSATKGVSCHQTVTDEIINDITCTDFSLPDQQKETISYCSLHWYSSPIHNWGWKYGDSKYAVNLEACKYNWINVVEAREPTGRSCSIKVMLHDDVIEVIGANLDKQKGIMIIYSK